MSADSKLPIPLQLVGITAVLVFSVTTVGTIGYVQAIVTNWQLIDTLPKTWEGLYYPIFFPPAFHAVLAILSAAMFAALVFAHRSVLAKFSLAYIAALLLALAWRIYVRVPAGGLDGLRLASTQAKVYLLMHAAYAGWLIYLAKAVLPNYSLKRTAVE